MTWEFPKSNITLANLVEEAERDRQGREVVIIPSGQYEILAAAMQKADVPYQSMNGHQYEEGEVYVIDLSKINII